ncbi:MAG: GHKL domain-containing protein [Oscillospiraceae bacterium]|nr:GHKL domain-containing protein [Oscillospiraceae bacterium]
MRANLAYFLYDLVTVITGILLLNDVELSKRNIIRRGFEILLWAAVSAALFFGLMKLFHTYNWRDHFVSRITVAVSLSFYALIFSRYNIETKITAICVLYTATFHLEFIRILIMGGPVTDNVLRFILGFLVYTGFIVGTALFIRRFSVKDKKSTPRLFCVIVLLTTAFSEFCSLGLSVTLHLGNLSKANSTMLGFLILGATFYIFNMLIYYLYYVMTTDYSRRGEMALLRQRQAESVAELERANRLYDEISVMRHEYKNRILSMDILLKSKQYDKLEKNFRKYISADAEVMNVINCGNRVLNCIFNVKRNDCTANNITFDVLAAVPAEMSFEDADLTSLLVNLIDNAMEGTAESSEPSVSVKMNVENNYLFITVINPVSDDVLGKNPQLSTTKKDKTVHGIGLRVVKNIVDKYNGHLKFEQQEGTFITSLMLEIPDSGINGI